MNIMTKTILIVILASIVAGTTYWFANRFANRPQTDVDVTIESITKIAKLATIQYRVSTVAAAKEHRKTKIWKKKFTQEYICTVKGIIEGKVNLKKADIAIKKGDDGGGLVTIRFGEGSVEVSQLEEDAVGGIVVKKISDAQYIEKYQFTEEQRNELIETARRETRQEAIKDGIVKMTQDQASVVISEFVGALGWRVDIEFDDKAFLSDDSG